ncbi:MAG TPA: cytochrome c3 family protein, partial [Deferrisomatales bacterium]|nr:cytochrome c3 family protein [Deferrisomatales bacterium]
GVSTTRAHYDGDTGIRDDLQALVRQLDSQAEAERRAAVAALLQLGARARPAAPQIERHLDTGSSVHRTDIIRILGAAGDIRSAGALIHRLDQGEPIPSHILDALQRITGKTYGPEQALWQQWWQEVSRTLPGAPGAHLLPFAGCVTSACHIRWLNPGEATHQPVREGRCDLCHQPPAEFDAEKHDIFDFEFGNLGERCLECHEALASRLGTSEWVHDPVHHGICDTCHDPHGSLESHYLKPADHPPSSTQQGWRQNAMNSHCISCHGADGFSEAGASSTRFTDAASNLHALHMDAAGTGGDCMDCHDTHASDQPHLLRSRPLADGNRAGAIGYGVLPSGGTCTTDCHERRSYTR